SREDNRAARECCNELLLLRRTGVKAQLRIRCRGESRLVPGELPQSVLPLRRRRRLRQLEILLEVPRLGARELRVEPAHLGRQARREQCKTLARARLDQRAREQQVELAPRVRRAQLRAQARSIAPRLLALERHLERDHELLHLLEMPQLLAREAR